MGEFWYFGGRDPNIRQVDVQFKSMNNRISIFIRPPKLLDVRWFVRMISHLIFNKVHATRFYSLNPCYASTCVTLLIAIRERLDYICNVYLTSFKF